MAGGARLRPRAGRCPGGPTRLGVQTASRLGLQGQLVAGEKGAVWVWSPLPVEGGTVTARLRTRATDTVRDSGKEPLPGLQRDEGRASCHLREGLWGRQQRMSQQKSAGTSDTLLGGSAKVGVGGTLKSRGPRQRPSRGLGCPLCHRVRRCGIGPELASETSLTLPDKIGN